MKSAIAVSAIFAVLFTAQVASAQNYTLVSPDGHLKTQISNDAFLQCSISRDEAVLVPSVSIAMELASGIIPAANSKVVKTEERKQNDVIRPPVAIKNALIRDEFNELTVKFENDVEVVFRAYNDAVSYRFETAMPGEILVKNETCDVTFPQGSTAWFAYNERWMSKYEYSYEKQPINALTPDKTTHLPLLVAVPGAAKVMITESDLYDYPSLYFTGDSSNTLQSILPPAVKSEKTNNPKKRNWDRVFVPKDTFDYIAKTSGTRAFPWRIFAVAEKDTDLLNNEIVYKLASPSRVKDTSWIKPGLVAWDWWNYWNLTGVDFRAGINTVTFKYYIDFASRNHIPYIVIDDGWYVLGDVTKEVPGINIKELADYGKQKNVGVMLWCVWRTLDNQLQAAMDLYEKWGIKGIKVDFMNRDDQDVNNFYWRCAEAAASHQMMVDYHGAHKPSGLQRTYPNVVNFEGLPGLEQTKWSDTMASPTMAVSLPFIRMFAGPMDYTPGAMHNATEKDFRAIMNTPMSYGTRCQQLAMYVLYDAPLQMLCDSPTVYEKEKESLDFITSVPTTWDMTFPLDGKVGEYIAMARKHGDNFYAGAMTNWTARDLTLDFSFLPEGKFQMVIFQDGINADRNGMDYKKVTREVTKSDKIKIHLAPGGGWAARIEPTAARQ